MTPLEMQNKITTLMEESEDLRAILHKKIGGGSADVRANIVQPSSVNATIPAGTITKTQISYEIATLAFGSGDTVKTASITNGSIIIGVYSSSVTSTPAYGELQLGIAATTLTGTRSASPGGAAAITYSVILLKA